MVLDQPFDEGEKDEKRPINTKGWKWGGAERGPNETGSSIIDMMRVMRNDSELGQRPRGQRPKGRGQPG